MLGRAIASRLRDGTRCARQAGAIYIFAYKRLLVPKYGLLGCLKVGFTSMTLGGLVICGVPWSRQVRALYPTPPHHHTTLLEIGRMRNGCRIQRGRRSQ